MRLLPKLLITAVLLALLVVSAYQSPSIQRSLSWRVDIVLTYLRGLIYPANQMPTPLPQPAVGITVRPTATTAPVASIPPQNTTPEPTLPPTPTPTPLPPSHSLPSPAWEKQDINNCGPASLAMYLRFYGWEGDQFDIANLLKPKREDRNVNVEELDYYVRTRVGWLNTLYRVGGNIDLLRRFVAAGIPVMIEEGFYVEDTFWPNDDHWAGHYLLITGYDDATQSFIGQDSFRGADQRVSYQSVKKNWQAFNYVYILIYLPTQSKTVQSILSILGDEWNVDINRQHALDLARAETEADPQNAFAWFNLGTNLVYFEQYGEAARAYDMARKLGLPQRMLRYQFAPFFAYFFSGRIDELMALTQYALQRTPNSEEAWLWQGWGYYRQGEKAKALASFQKALEMNPSYQDAHYALDFVRENP